MPRESSCESANDSDWEEAEATQEEAPSLCLFCSEKFNGDPTAALEHCADVHGFQLPDLIAKLGEVASYCNYYF